ncbi:hypothetical protein PIIN_00031 [Serendipita indica DSM 11827]|uniref:DASH complex subunit DUO1 n=1 Tax=Serendipita indica (strain DSM 11827) TaxID=1109443 RepID=G4T4U8_SERID|nr:hypothetical protein PIIN_00031 [Serendipita indica DSM 11827]
MAHFTGFEGNLADTTPLKLNTRHGGDDMSVSDLSTTPQFRWMGDAAPATPGSVQDEKEASGDTSWMHEQSHDVIEQSFDETLQFQQTTVDEDADRSGMHTPVAPGRNNEDQELEEFAFTLRKMRRTINGMTDVLRSTIPEYQRMQRAIENWDSLSKQYNAIMIETEKTARVLEDPSWPGRDLEELQLQQAQAAEEERRRLEEAELELQRQREEEERQERLLRERLEQERLAKQSSVRGRGRGRGVPPPTRGLTGSTGSLRGSKIARGAGSSVSSRGSVSSRVSVSSVRGRYS